MAPSRAERSQVSSVTRNFRAKLKNAAGPFDALTAMTCRGGAFCASLDGCVLSDGWSLVGEGPRSSPGDADAGVEV